MATDRPGGTDADLEPFVSRLDYPVYVVTTQAGDDRAGCLVGFTTQTSIDPPRFLVCISKANATSRTVAAATHLAVHQLAPKDMDVARLFGEESEDWTDKFAQCSWQEGPYEVPGLDAAVGGVVGGGGERGDGGDHDRVLLAPGAAGGP